MTDKVQMSRLPNALTISRLFLTAAFLVLLGVATRWSLFTALALFLAAGATDVLDGYFARRRESLTDFGRLADPFVDKILICGGFTLLVGKVDEVKSWAAAVITTRELFVSALRSYVEAHGRSFPADVWGKSKMCLQWLTLGLIVLTLAAGWRGQRLHQALLLVVYLTVLATAISGLASLHRARRVWPGTMTPLENSGGSSQSN